MDNVGPFKCSELPPIGYDEVLCGLVSQSINYWFVGTPYEWNKDVVFEGCINFMSTSYTNIWAQANYWMPLPEVAE